MYWSCRAPTGQEKQPWWWWRRRWRRSSARGGPPSCCPAPPPQTSGTTNNTRAWHLSPAPAHMSAPNTTSGSEDRVRLRSALLQVWDHVKKVQLQVLLLPQFNPAQFQFGCSPVQDKAQIWLSSPTQATDQSTGRIQTEKHRQELTKQLLSSLLPSSSSFSSLAAHHLVILSALPLSCPVLSRPVLPLVFCSSLWPACCSLPLYGYRQIFIAASAAARMLKTTAIQARGAQRKREREGRREEGKRMRGEGQGGLTGEKWDGDGGSSWSTASSWGCSIHRPLYLSLSPSPPQIDTHYLAHSCRHHLSSFLLFSTR